jgi:hypothetical protein
MIGFAAGFVVSAAKTNAGRKPASAHKRMIHHRHV